MNRSTVNRSALLVPPKKQDNWSSIKTEGKEKGLFLSLSLPLSLVLSLKHKQTLSLTFIYRDNQSFHASFIQINFKLTSKRCKPTEIHSSVKKTADDFDDVTDGSVKGSFAFNSVLSFELFFAPVAKIGKPLSCKFFANFSVWNDV